MMSTPENDMAMLPPPSNSNPTVTDPFQKEQTVLILVGLIASGKSTFAEALESHFPRFRRCNQDDLGDRQQVEELAYDTLCEGRSPCIDRTNFNAVQRSYWTAIARSFPNTSISIIVFDTPYQTCASRLESRTSHPTIRDAQHGLAVLRKFASDFQMPSPDEGYDHIIHLRPADHPRPEYTRDDISSILERLKASTRNAAPSSVTQRGIAPESFPGRSGRSSRTGGRARGYRGGTFRSTPGTLYGSFRSTSRVRGLSDSNWRRPSTSVVRSEVRSATAPNMTAMEGSKERPGGGRHNST